MKQGTYFVMLLLSVVCVVLAAGLVVLGETNIRRQANLQVQQQRLNQGFLGQQAQQISAAVLKDMAELAVGNGAMRQILEKHGLQVQPGTSVAAVGVNASGENTAVAESVEEEGAQ